MINSINTSIPLLIVWILGIVGSHPIMNSIYDLTSGTPTGGAYNQTLTGTTSTLSQTFTPTITLSLTPTPTGPTSTPSQTSTPTITPSLTPTTTLMPLPAITLIFPAPTISSTPTKTTTPALGTHTPSYSVGNKLESVSPRTIVLSIIIVLLWIILACFLVIYIRQFR